MKGFIAVLCFLGVSTVAVAEHATYEADLPEGGTEISVDTPDATVSTVAAPGERYEIRTVRGFLGLGLLNVQKTRIVKEDGSVIKVVTTPWGTRTSVR